ncbi:MAG: urease accessory protein [Gemmatirosa sp.]
MDSILLLGLLSGMRHALEADHLAAVASLATGGRSARTVMLQGAAWGLGHTATLLLVGGVCLLLGAAIPERTSVALELGVGVMLVLLGAQALWRAYRPRRAPHVHEAALPRRALVVGAVHGLAGSAALLVLTLAAVRSPWAGLAYVGLFGAGSIAGMVALCAAMSVPLRLSARLSARAFTGMEVLFGAATIVIGVRLIHEMGTALT